MNQDISLFNEIDESLRADKLEGLLKKYGKYLVYGCVGIVLAAIVSVVWKNHVKESNAENTTLIFQARELIDSGKYADAIAKLKEAEQGRRGIATIAGLYHAEALQKSGKFDEAAKLYLEIADKRNAGEVVKDIATINSSVLASNHNLSGQDAKLPSEWNRPFSALAVNLTALRLHKEGKTKEATQMLKSVVENAALSAPERSFAKELLDLLSGEKQ